MQFAGYGQIVNPLDFSAEEVVRKLNELLYKPDYLDRIKKASAAFRAEKHPAERASDAIEHVLLFGSDHLRPLEALKLTWWEFYCLDVLALVFLLFALFTLLMFTLLKCILRSTLYLIRK